MKKRAKAEREELELRMDKLREKQELTTQAFERRAQEKRERLSKLRHKFTKMDKISQEVSQGVKDF